jgi:hypothetical protein
LPYLIAGVIKLTNWIAGEKRGLRIDFVLLLAGIILKKGQFETCVIAVSRPSA